MAIINLASIILAFAITNVLGQNDYILAKRVDVSPQLAERATFIGGWALGGGLTTCPTDTISCANTSSAITGVCCPTNTFCVSQGLGLGAVCCPSSADCGEPLQTIPACADPTWTLFNGIRKYFCCAPGDIGIFPNGGLSILVGLCVPGDQNVPASVRATAVGAASATSSAAAASKTSAAASTTANSGSAATSAAAASASAAPTKNAGIPNVASLAGAVGGVFGGFMFQAFV